MTRHICHLYVRQFTHEPEPEDAQIKCWYPEHEQGLTISEFVERARGLLCTEPYIVTTSEHMLLLGLQLHREKIIVLKPYAGVEPQRVDELGELVYGWPGGLFNQRLDMLFPKE